MNQWKIDPGFIDVFTQGRHGDIVKLWLGSLDEGEKFFLTRLTGEEGKSLNLYFSRIKSLLDRDADDVEMPSPQYLPMESVLRQISVLLKGKRIFLEVLKKSLPISDQEWFFFRRDFNNRFHQLLRRNSDTACDACRLNLDQRTTEIQEMEAHLTRRSQSNHSHNAPE